MLTLGFNAYAHHSAACIVKDGVVLAAGAEERFSRVKNDGRFPEGAIRFCLDRAGVAARDLDNVAFHWEPWVGFHKRVLSVLSAGARGRSLITNHGGTWRDILLAGHTWRQKFDPGFGKHIPFFRVKHHLSHAALVYYQSRYPDSAILVIDGNGEIASTSMGIGSGNKIKLFQHVDYPHSLGYLFVALTHYLGFKPESDEYKLMSLASFGEHKYTERFRKLVRLKSDGGFEMDLGYFDYHLGGRDPWVSRRFVEEFGPVRLPGSKLDQRHADIALALQTVLEETVMHMAVHLRKVTGSKYLCMAGGVALNSVMNGRLLREGPFDDITITPAANDAGCCMGAALALQVEKFGVERPGEPRNALLGPDYSAQECKAALLEAGLPAQEFAPDALLEKSAQLLMAGRVVGWFQGRMEMGPRALGARSILADPRNPEMKDRLNDRVKHRESFRPFAPAAPEEAASRWFEIDRPSPYMLFVVPVRPEARELLPSITHVDGTARLQTVARDSNPIFYDLLDRFGARTGIPVILNTSFNVAGEPIVCSPRDAVRCFMTTGIDDLVVGPFVVSKP